MIKSFEVLRTDDAVRTPPCAIRFEDDPTKTDVTSVQVCYSCPGAIEVIEELLQSGASVKVVGCRGNNGCGSDNETLEAGSAYGNVPMETQNDGIQRTPVVIQANNSKY